jgi:glyoxylase-like metal-dependent hydrolase (beta-lactamase superfamily II)
MRPTGEQVRVGEIGVTPMVTSRFRLDGGSMFGVVPRVLWEKKAPPDERNRVTLNLNTLLIESGGELILVDPGMGSKFDERWVDIYALEEHEVRGELERLGIRPDDIDAVVLTHLHLDHAGGSTMLDDSGRPVPAFPNAKYYAQDEEWREARDPHPLERASYLPSDFLPLERDGILELLAGAGEIAPGVRVEPAAGHTSGHQIVRMLSDGEEAIYLGDLVPTTAHLKLNWLMGWDLRPELIYAEKGRVLAEAADRGTLLFFAHDPDVFAARVTADTSGDFQLVPETVIRARMPGEA